MEIEGLLSIWNGAEPLRALYSFPAQGWFYCLEDGCVTTEVCESWDTQCPAKCWFCLCCHKSLTSLLRCQDPPRPPPFPFQADTPKTCFYKWALGPTLWAWFLSKQGMPYKLLARAQLALKCQRTSVLMFQVCCPGGVIALSISADWFLMWPGLLLFFPLHPPNSNFPVSPIFACCLCSPMYRLWPSRSRIHDPTLLPAASPGLAHSLIISSLLYSQPCPRFPSPSFFSTIDTLSLGDSIQGLERSK